MSRWSDAELAALRKAPDDYARFADLTNFSKSYDAWEVKRRRIMQEPGETSPLLLMRAVQNNVKVARQMIRLRHSIEADDELSSVIPRIKETLEGQAHQGSVPGLSYEQLRSLIYG